MISGMPRVTAFLILAVLTIPMTPVNGDSTTEILRECVEPWAGNDATSLTAPYRGELDDVLQNVDSGVDPGRDLEPVCEDPAPGQRGIVDGLDLNPLLAGNFIGVRLDGFQFLDAHIDKGNANAREYAELFVSPLSVDMPFIDSKYQISINPGASVPMQVMDCWAHWYDVEYTCKNLAFRDLPDLLFDKLSDSSNLGAAPSGSDFGVGFTESIWKVERVTTEPIVRFQLPETIPNLDLKNMKVTVSMTFKDEDVNDHDTFDLNPDSAKKSAEITADLMGDSVGCYSAEVFGLETFKYYDDDERSRMMIGSLEKSSTSNDAKLRVEIGDTIPRHFVQGIPIVQSGGVAHLNDATGAGGRDFFGHTGDLPCR